MPDTSETADTPGERPADAESAPPVRPLQRLADVCAAEPRWHTVRVHAIPDGQRNRTGEKGRFPSSELANAEVIVSNAEWGGVGTWDLMLNDGTAAFGQVVRIRIDRKVSLEPTTLASVLGGQAGVPAASSDVNFQMQLKLAELTGRLSAMETTQRSGGGSSVLESLAEKLILRDVDAQDKRQTALVDAERAAFNKGMDLAEKIAERMGEKDSWGEGLKQLGETVRSFANGQTQERIALPPGPTDEWVKVGTVLARSITESWTAQTTIETIGIAFGNEKLNLWVNNLDQAIDQAQQACPEFKEALTGDRGEAWSKELVAYIDSVAVPVEDPNVIDAETT